MCGIYGAGTARSLDPEILVKLDSLGKALQHRGPDANSQVIEDTYFLGFNRLAIVDIENGMQPFFSSDKRIIATVNGEIYNYLELREEVIGLGIKLETESDIEVIPHLYAIYGDDFVLKLRGMFAIAMIDNRSSELKLFVDRLGEKPLYWFFHEETFIYSSEVVPLLESRIANMHIDLNQVPPYLKYGFVLDPYTIIKDVYRVAAGTVMTFSLENNSLIQKKYWNLSNVNEPLPNPITTIRKNFENVANSICQGKAKVGIALSSGTDSKLVSKLALSTGSQIEAITIGYFEQSRHDETLGAVQTAKELGIKSHVKKISSEEAAISLREVCRYLDEPVSDISSINYLALFESASNLNIRVLLMGHGSDELLMSYAWFNNAVIRANTRASTLRGEFQLRKYVQIIQNPFSRYVTRSTFQYLYTVRENLFSIRQMFRDLYDFRNSNRIIDFFELSPLSRAKSSYSKKLQNKLNLELKDYRKINIDTCSNDLKSLARVQILSDYLRLNGLLQIDKLSMSRSIEVRNPLVDFELVETVLRANWNHSKLPGKAILRAGSNTLMSQISEPLRKRGFSPPTRLWYRTILSTYFTELNHPRSIELGLFPKNWNRYFKRPFSWYGTKSPIWFELVMIEIWIRETEKRVGLKFSQGL